MSKPFEIVPREIGFPPNDIAWSTKLLPKLWVSVDLNSQKEGVCGVITPGQILISFSTICTLVSFHDRISASPTSDDRFVRDSLRAIDLDVIAHGVASV